MDSKWSKKWKKCLVWFSAYFSFIAFALVGGYIITKNEDEELKKTTKLAFIVTLIFAAVSGFMTVFYNLASLSNNFYNSTLYDVYDIVNTIVNVARIDVFAAFIILGLLKDDSENNEEKPLVEEK